MNKTVSIIVTLGLVVALGIIFLGGAQNLQKRQMLQIQGKVLRLGMAHNT